MKPKDHWEHVYKTKKTDGVSWYQEHADQSLHLIKATGVPQSAKIIDVGGGASTLVDDLLQAGYSDLTVLDVSRAALDAARARLGGRAHAVHWLESDITKTSLPLYAFDIWHDRAAFHFLTDKNDRNAYVDAVRQSVKPGGHVIVASFAGDGPLQCSGLNVMRYSAGELHAEFGSAFELLRHVREDHHTPFGTIQKFVYCYCRKVQ